jgi:hypothetical protein
MRRVPTGLIAAGYALSFLVVCLGACLAPAAAGGHGCCQQGEGLSAPSADCCSVVPGVTQAAPAAAGPPALLAAPISMAPAPARPAGHAAVPVSTPSPPLIVVLRV